MSGAEAQAQAQAPAAPLPAGPRLRLGRAAVTRWVVPVGILLVWEVAVRAGWIEARFFPAPSSLVTEIWTDLRSGKLAADSAASLTRLLSGLGIGVVAGIAIGTVMSVSRLMEELLSVPVQVLRAIPPITWIGFSILWFGLGTKPAVFLISLGVVFPMLLNTYAGVRQVDLIYLRAARNLGARRWMLFKDVLLPAALPSVLTGLRVSVGLAWILMVVGELVAVPSGLGDTLMRAQDYAQTDRMLAYMLLIGFYGFLSDLLVMALTGWCLRWQRGMDG